tara:strand:+ start:5754 stop:6503 length:750 start_codon:yes stop_codon:yes gene_type:complete
MNKTVFITSGGFDPIHEGHINMLQDCTEEADVVIVLLNSDDWLARKKGKFFMNFSQRKTILESVVFIDYVLGFNDDDGTCCDGLSKVLALYPDADLVFANGGDRNSKNTPEVLFCEANEIELLWSVGGEKTQSSSNLISSHFNKLVARDWGLWSVLKNYSNTKVKELIIYPEESLSYQKHEYRNEAWFLVSGQIDILLDDKLYSVKPHELFIIPKEAKHRVINTSFFENAHIIEIQYGEKCYEEDIIRY